MGAAEVILRLSFYNSVSRSPSHAVLMVRSAIQAEIIIYFCSKLSVPAGPALSI